MGGSSRLIVFPFGIVQEGYNHYYQNNYKDDDHSITIAGIVAYNFRWK